jgi:hypothetical protein
MRFGNEGVRGGCDNEQIRLLIESLSLNHGPAFGRTYFSREGRKSLHALLKSEVQAERADSDLSVEPDGGSQ